MRSIGKALVTGTIAITIPLGMASASATTHQVGQLTLKRGSLDIRPIEPVRILGPKDRRRSQFCHQLKRGVKCPPVVLQGGPGGGILGADDFKYPESENARVRLTVMEVSTDAIAGSDGVDNSLGELVVNWTTESSQEDVLGYDGIFAHPLPDPGETDNSWYVIYDALVLGGCDSFPVYDIDHTASVEKGGYDEIGSFNGVDDSTVDHVGYYQFEYTVDAQAGSDASRLSFRGEVSVLCTGVDNL